MKGILGRKIGMTQVFSKNGQLVPVSVIEVEPNVVAAIKTIAKNGYSAVQLATGKKRESLFNKPDLGQFAKHKLKPRHFIKEIKGEFEYKVGDLIQADIFTAGEFVDVTGVSKGKGFSGVIKRYNQKTGPKSHGSHYHRAVGSMGAISPSRVFKGKGLPGHMGHESVTVQSLEVVQADATKNVLLVKGAVPGPKKGWLVIRANVHNKKAKTPIVLNSYTKAAASSEVSNGS